MINFFQLREHETMPPHAGPGDREHSPGYRLHRIAMFIVSSQSTILSMANGVRFGAVAGKQRLVVATQVREQRPSKARRVLSVALCAAPAVTIPSCLVVLQSMYSRVQWVAFL